MVHLFAKNEAAAEAFNKLAEKMTGHPVPMTDDPAMDGDLIILGSEADNLLMANRFLNGDVPMPRFRSGSDDYFIYSIPDNGRTILLLGGGRTRAVFYAVYAYFEALGCSYFWDGDRIPHAESLSLDGFHVEESPRFEYRGLRYFAHRSLHRFQAEHWTLDDWKKEIDWILKKRLNLFMLRIGQDDLFQKAFPDIVPYPEDNEPAAPENKGSFNDRTHFWSLQERGKLRKSVLTYAFEHDLMHPEDTGTMSHWYSRTPKEFLDAVKPEFVPQANLTYKEPTGRVWDIRDDKNLENYFKLTQAHIDHYGSPAIFHTIGLAERDVSSDKQENHRWKLYTYRRIVERLRKSYPDAPLLLASWDFLNNGWTSDEMRDLLAMMDPKNTILFDYTSDTDVENNNFVYWHCVGKFPWIFGIFHAWEAGNDIRGNYNAINRRLAIAKDDPYCKGMVIWPECSHGDTLMYEFFAANAWRPDYLNIRDFIPVFCQKRYGAENAKFLEDVWTRFLPAIESGYWNWHQFYGESFAHLHRYTLPEKRDQLGYYGTEADRLKPGIVPCVDALAKLAECPLDDPMLRRDVIDLARTAGGRIFQFLFNTAALRSILGKDMAEILDLMREVLHALADIVKSSPEFSLCCTLDGLKSYRPVNPVFEQTLKNNTEANYCRTYTAELFDALYFPEFEVYAAAGLGAKTDPDAVSTIREKFYGTALEIYRPDCQKHLAVLPETIRALSGMAERAAKFIE